MHSSNMGHVPREVGLHDHFLELCWSPIRMHYPSIPFTNLLTTSQTYCYSVVYMASHDPSKYHFSTPTYVALYVLLLTSYYM